MIKVLQIAERVALSLLVAVLALWVGDWAVFRVQAARGHGYDSVQVEQYLATALKGNKEEYDYLGQTQVSCARALFPHGGTPPCWWQRRHHQQWE